jgi:hypothetical protein
MTNTLKINFIEELRKQANGDGGILPPKRIMTRDIPEANSYLVIAEYRTKSKPKIPMFFAQGSDDSQVRDFIFNRLINYYHPLVLHK